MADGMNLGQLMQLSAWGLGLGTLFFAFFGQRVPRDFFLTIGLVACIGGDLAFVAFLMENDFSRDEEAPDGSGRRSKGNATMVSLFVGFALLALYGLSSQLWKYKEHGFVDDDDDDEDGADAEHRAAAASATAAGNAARPGVEPPEEAAARAARSAAAAKPAAALRDAAAAAT
jgi:hypothetical protein